jgi:hypothetical protein
VGALQWENTLREGQPPENTKIRKSMKILINYGIFTLTNITDDRQNIRNEIRATIDLPLGGIISDAE